ncbi:hypothetical protein D3C72_2128110 [compost metagenome]
MSWGFTASARALSSQACRHVADWGMAIASSRSRLRWRSDVTRRVSSLLTQMMPLREPSSPGTGLKEKV